MDDSPERHQRVRAAFDAALGKAPAVRERFLQDVCGEDADLRRQVARLLAAHANARLFLEDPPGAPLDAEPEDFPGTDRFTIRGRLGAGGMGIVYEAYDRERDEVVALKTLRRTGAADLYRLKREFRGLANVAHRNLVCLYELFVDADRGFFTMELVRGVTFVDHVRAGAPNGRILPAFAQLVDGVSALHRAGKLHRDIKPSNVLVTSEGRVVILDFGLMAELFSESRAGADSADHAPGGTPGYMSPEEIRGAPPSEAGDWYGVGVTLYEALTARLPFAGSSIERLQLERDADPPSPRKVSGDVAEEWDTICMALLHRDPERRLSGRDALRRLRHETDAADDDEASSVRAAPFVGREAELDALHHAFETVKRGRAATVQVLGSSGIGKTALLRHFLQRLTASGAAVIFHGRCYEHESVPYKALDGVVDSISRFLSRLPRQEADELLPPDVATLSRVFPVLLQCSAVRDAAVPADQELADPARLRHRAITALRELLTRVARLRPVVLSIDDFQWTDVDSVAVLEELVGSLGADAPAGVLTVLCARSEEMASNPLLRSTFGLAPPKRLSLDPMSDEDASALIASLVTAHAPDVAALAQEAQGNPFLLEQFARHIARQESRHRRPDGRTTFADVFDAQLETLPAGARAFLETLALCGRPMAPEIVRDASTVSLELRPLLAVLRAAHVIRSSGSAERIEPYHDRIREALVDRLAPDAVRRLHGELANVLRARRVDDPVALFEHCRGAGDDQEAAVQAGRAAERAAAALAFDTAAWYYRQALDLSSGSPARQAWQAAGAAALANAGRPHEAGEAYLDASRETGASARVELQRCGAEQFLIGGHIDRGLDMLRTVLDDVGMRVPSGPRSALASLLVRRAWLRWRGLAFVERRAADIPADVLLRIDTCWSVMTGLATVDMIRASAFSALHVRLALDAGEPYRIARALAVEAAFSALPGGSSRPRTAALLERARTLAQIVDRPHTAALAALAAGMAALGSGRFSAAAASCGQALDILRDHCTGVTWELNAAQNFLLGALLYQGELHDVSTRLPPLLADARSRGNLYVSTELCTRMNLVWLAADRPDEGERLAVESIERWSQTGFHRQHYSAMLARVQTALYRDEARRAWALLDDSWTALRKALLLQAQLVRVEAFYLRGRCALAMARAEPAGGRFLGIAEACARRIAREGMAWSNPIARLLEAGVASQKGETKASVQRLTAAVAGFDAAGMQLYAAAARRRLADLLAGEDAIAIRRQADGWMAGQRVVDPARMTRMMAPGFAPVIS